MSDSNGDANGTPSAPQVFSVELFGGGEIYLQSAQELSRWETLATRYRDDYRLTKTNDLALLDLVLQQHILSFRAQNSLNGMEPVLDANDLPTGAYSYKQPSKADAERSQKSMVDASKEIRALEKVLGIDRSSRESQGGHTVDEYLKALKTAANEYGVHISNRLKAYEQVVADLRWKVRLEENGDDEDKRYHDCTAEGIVRWAREELAGLEEVDKKFANEKQRVWLGKL